MKIDSQKTVIWWVRRDLRLHDNQALDAALASGHPVVPLFILDDILLKHSSPRRSAFLYKNLRSLDTSLRDKGSYLVLRTGDPLDCLRELAKQSNATTIFAEEDHTPYARKRDEKIAAALPLQLFPGVTIQSPSQVYKQDGNPYVIFTPYARQWRSSLLPFHIRKTPDRINTPAGLISKPIPTSTPHLLFPAGEQAAQERLKIFLKNDIQAYSTNKDRLGEDGTSLLSPYLHFGVLSARFVYQQAQLQKQLETSTASVEGIEAWVNELIWRDFYTMILAHFPAVLNGPYREEYAHIQWIDREEDFALWRSGLTGYPLVDAGMRQLQECGWMHNRARMIVASFLCKDLLINWQWGEDWFYQHLIDGDLAANNGGWQWSAGTGTDAAPYFRIFNPITQSRKFDPSGSYIRRWVPVLKRVPDIYIHTPWEMPLDIQQNVNCIIGKDYPLPIVEHTFARQRTLEAYKMVKK